jgi:hypothetical protein
MIDNSYWLKILAVLIALAIALIELWKPRENKGRLHLWGLLWGGMQGWCWKSRKDRKMDGVYGWWGL